MMDQLSELWSEFAGPIPTNLYLSQNNSQIDQDLLHDLDDARLKFSSIQRLRHYFSPPPTSSTRKTQWAESRRSILRALEGYPSSPDVWLSLTHTQEESLVIACHDTNKFITGIGVDMEEVARKIEAGASEKFILTSEKSLGLSEIAIWTIKEASYKADTLRQGTMVSQYEIKSYDNKTGIGRAGLERRPSSFIRFKYLVYHTSAITFAIAER